MKSLIAHWMHLFACTLLLTPIGLHADAIADRIRPIGTLTIQADATAQRPKAPTERGKDVYEQHCIVCHGSGVAGAPTFNNKRDWGERMTKKNLDALTASAVKGLNVMPPKGTCSECSEADLKAAITYMVPK